MNLDLFRTQLGKEVFLGDICQPREKARIIVPEVLAKLPKDHTIIGFVEYTEGEKCEAILLRFYDKQWRVCHFRLSDGAYLSDYIL